MSQTQETPPVRVASLPLNSLRNAPGWRDTLNASLAKLLKAKETYDADLAEAREIASQQAKHIDLAHRAEWTRNAFKAAQKQRLADFRTELDTIWADVRALGVVEADIPDKRQVLALLATRMASAELAATMPLIDSMGARELESFAGLLLADVGANADGVEPSKADLASAAAVLARLSKMSKAQPFTSSSFAAKFKTPTIDGSLAALGEAKAVRARIQDFYIDLSRDGELRAITKMKHANGGKPLEALDDGAKLPETL